MHILERVRLLNQDRACLPSAGMLNGSLECHHLKGILQEGRLVSNVYVICKAKVSTANWQYVVKGEIRRFLSEALLGMWVEFSRLTPVNIIHISGLLLSFIKTPERDISFKVLQLQQLLLSPKIWHSKQPLNKHNLLWGVRAHWNTLLWLIMAS